MRSLGFLAAAFVVAVAALATSVACIDPDAHPRARRVLASIASDNEEVFGFSSTLVEEQQPPAQPPRVLAVVASYKDDISWLLSEDHGGDAWTARIPATELYQIADTGVDGCDPTFPGLTPNMRPHVDPAPTWPAWAADWAAEKCSVARAGIIPASPEDSERMAAVQAGLLPPLAPADRSLPALNASDGSGVVYFPKLTPFPLQLVPNKASEALAYLTSIIVHYDNLPDLMLFMHGHRTSWHSFPWGQDWTLDRLAALPPRNLSRTAGYMPLSCVELSDGANRVFPSNIGANHWSPVSLGPRWHMSFAAHIAQAWEEHLGAALGRPLPDYIQAPPGATFAVEKAAILRHSKAFYEGLRAWALATPMERWWTGAVFEFLWALIFTGQEVIDPPRDQCLCELYDICLGGGPGMAAAAAAQR